MSEHTLQQANIAVIGAGTMGIGIAQLAAMHGHPTQVFDVDVTKTMQAVQQLQNNLEKLVEKGKFTAQFVQQTLDNIQVVEQIESLSQANVVIEAIVERKEVKQKLFQQLAQISAADTILASNTSSISITAIASAVQHPERVVGLHFFNPAPAMKLVEIIQGLQTSEAICSDLHHLMLAWGKTPVKTKSTPGFIVNRIARPFYAETLRALQEQVATPAQLDFILRQHGGFAMGACELMDLIGQDVNFSVTQSVYQEFFHEARYRPSLVQKELVDAGYLGRKSGQGFYRYQNGQTAEKYQPQAVTASKPHVTITVKGHASSNQALIQRLQNAHALHRVDATESSIWIDDIQLQLTQGTSASLMNQSALKTVLFDWHEHWENAQTIVVTASCACTESDRNKVAAVLQAAGLTAIWIKDYPGLIAMRTIVMLVNEACEALLHGIASAEDIDAAMRYGVNYPKGPLQWGKEIGYSKILQLLENLYASYGEEKYRPSLYLKQLVAQQQVTENQELYRQAG